MMRVLCCSEVIEFGNLCPDVAITIVICKSIVIIVLIAVLGSIIWKLIDLHAMKDIEKRKRAWEVEDRKQKHKAELLERKLTTLKDKPDSEKYLSTIDEELNKNYKNGTETV